MTHTLIVGAGIAGLSAAFDLERAGLNVTVVDRRNRLGGAIETHRIDVGDGARCVLEGGADSFISQKPAALQLITDAGLAADVIGSNDYQRLTYIKRNGSLIPLPDGMMMMLPTRVWPMAKTALLSWPTKIRMGLEYFQSGARPGASGERSVAEFILQHFPQEMLDYLVEPLLSGVYGGDPALLSADAVLPRFVDMERKYGSLVKASLSTPMPKSSTGGSLFKTLKGGLGSLVDAIRPKNVQLGREVEAIEQIHGTNPRWRVRIEGDWLDIPNVVLTGPAYMSANLLQPVAPRAAELLNTVGYSSSATVTLIYRASKLSPLKGFGLLVPRVERKRLLACTFVRNKFNHRIPEGWEAIRCFFGGASDEAAVRESDQTLQTYAREELRDLLKITAEPDFAVVSRWDRAMAQYGLGHAARIAELRSEIDKLPGLFLAGNAYQGIGVPDCIETGRAVAKKIASTRAG